MMTRVIPLPRGITNRNEIFWLRRGKGDIHRCESKDECDGIALHMQGRGLEIDHPLVVNAYNLLVA